MPINPMRNRFALALIAALLLFRPAFGAQGEPKTVTGELIDTWCYVSQIMGASDFIVGTTHHVCAVWCAAGGIPVGLLDKDDGTIYMVLGVGDNTDSVANSVLMDIQSHEITAEGTAYVLDGINYLMIDRITADNGVTKETHKIVGILPGEANPK